MQKCIAIHLTLTICDLKTIFKDKENFKFNLRQKFRSFLPQYFANWAHLILHV